MRVHVHAYTGSYIHPSIFFHFQLKLSSSIDTLVIRNTPNAQIFLIKFSNKISQGFLGKWLILVLRKEMLRINLEHSVVLESKEAPKEVGKGKL